MDIKQDMSAEIGDLAAALALAQGEMTFAHKDSSNPFFNSRYADLAAVWDAVREPLSKNGIAVVQTTDSDAGKIVVITKLLHKSGQWIEGRLSMTPEKNGPQAYGSTLTYARRYALAAITGIAQADDDAEAATARKTAPEIIPDSVWDEAAKVAKDGISALEKWFKGLPKPKKEILAADGKRWELIKNMSADIEAQKAA